MKISGWGRYPIIDSQTLFPNQAGLVQSWLNTQTSNLSQQTIARGLGRSYGDSSLANTTIHSKHLNHFIEFDYETGELCCLAGVSFSEILQTFIPLGWFLPVTPGTQFVTVGGAIASDVHGKNHHLDGSFSDHLIELTLCLANGDIVNCSLSENRELFLATCGGMGLTGFILKASFKLIAINSAFINETIHKTENLTDTLALFEEHQQTTYSVAWIDCLATGSQLGRSLLMLGEHSQRRNDETELQAMIAEAKLNMPLDLPGFTLNSYSVKAFNQLYYHKVRQQKMQRTVEYGPFFYPLDKIQNWNRMYGKNGFVQYQFVLPKKAGLEGLTKILTEIANSKRGSFLAVLKAFGQGNDNYLSFPEEGYTLALDFKMDSTLLTFLDRLDDIVLEYGGKLYLTKDARMSERVFKASYTQWEKFQDVRHQYGANTTFNSLQSSRLGL